MTIDHSSKKPMHLQIREDLLKKILSGYYKENQLIPKEVELAEDYGVSRPTVRQSIQSLVNEGYLERKKRKGTIVRRRKIPQEFTHIIESYNAEMDRKGLLPNTKVLTFKEEVANEEIAENLEIKEGDGVYKLIRLRFIEDDPIVLVTTYLPAKLLKDFLNVDFSQQQLYSVLAKQGYPVKSVRRKLEVMKAGETVGALLDIDEIDPIFYFHTVGYTDCHVPIEYSISKYRGDLNSFIFEISNHTSDFHNE
ncbi:GntR family transcriptional regulator [Sporolactobacillus sp. Y61]|uniref:GntR family transcriptional regulator n=1 Tax=Sporolactobacillus sp. Y61 TaxID=3160863 RepID=A0AAU8IIL5_9BACL